MTKPPWFTLTGGVRATATWTATGRGSATLRTRADFSAMWTGSLYCLSKYSAFPTIFDLTSPFFQFSLQTSTLLTVRICYSDSTCGDLRAQYFFVWGVSRRFNNTNILRSKCKRFPWRMAIYEILILHFCQGASPKEFQWTDNIYIYFWQGASGMRYLSNEACDSQTDLSVYARNS